METLCQLLLVLSGVMVISLRRLCVDVGESRLMQIPAVVLGILLVGLGICGLLGVI